LITLVVSVAGQKRLVFAVQACYGDALALERIHYLPSGGRDLLGHASIVTTERYDNQKPEALMAAAKRLETGQAPFACTHERRVG
jgi:hypothetical protein